MAENKTIDELSQKLNALHKEVEAYMAESKRAGLQIGEALYTKKLEMSSHEYGAWMRNNLEFDTTIANRYLTAFQKAEIKQWQGFDL